MIELMNTAPPPTSDPQALEELRQTFAPSSTPAALEALSQAPTVPERIKQMNNLLQGWVYYSKKQKIALERFFYQEALRSHQLALELSLKTGALQQVNVKKRKGSILQSTRKGKAPVQGLFVPPKIYFPREGP